MLTKDLLRFRIRRNCVKPDFISVTDPELLNLAGKLIGVYTQGLNLSRVDLETVVANYVSTYKDLKIIKGFNKLLLDRCEFAHKEGLDCSIRRNEILNQAAKVFGEYSFDTAEKFRERVVGQTNTLPLYADLPYNERLIKFKEVFPKELLERFNVALVQGLLLTTNRLTVKTREHKAVNLRRVFKFLKFFRLLSRIFQEDKGVFRIEIDGPMSILDSSRKYGLQLASFFPAICNLTDWQLTCETRVKKRVCQLVLDHSSGLVSHYRNLSSYVPDEVMMFANHFKETMKEWSMTPDTPFINVGGAEFMFPDFTLVNAKGKQIYLELFHRWHRSNLIPRLRFCIENPDHPIILGIDRYLLNDDIDSLLNTGVLSPSRYFTFSDYPTVGKVRKCLNSFD